VKAKIKMLSIIQTHAHRSYIYMFTSINNMYRDTKNLYHNYSLQIYNIFARNTFFDTFETAFLMLNFFQSGYLFFWHST